MFEILTNKKSIISALSCTVESGEKNSVEALSGVSSACHTPVWCHLICSYLKTNPEFGPLICFNFFLTFS